MNRKLFVFFVVGCLFFKPFVAGMDKKSSSKEQSKVRSSRSSVRSSSLSSRSSASLKPSSSSKTEYASKVKSGISKANKLLGMEDLVNLCGANAGLHDQTCAYFKKHFPARAIAMNNNLYTEHGNFLINCFSPVVESMTLYNNSDTLNLLEFKNLKEIELIESDLNLIRGLKQFLPNLHTLKLIECHFDGEIYESILKRCENLKRLYVSQAYKVNSPSKYLIGDSNDWLTRYFPNLEHFELNTARKIDKVITFLKRHHKKLHTFSINLNFLLNNPKLLMLASNIKFSLTTLAILHEGDEISPLKYEKIMKDLWNLRKSNVFENLNLYFQFYENILETDSEYIQKILPFVKKIYVPKASRRIALTGMTNLEQLTLSECRIKNLEETLTNLTMLNTVCFFVAKISKIIPFIEKVPTLDEIIIHRLNCEDSVKMEAAINLEVLHSVRKSSGATTPLKLYVEESVYLLTKKLSNRQNYLIKVKRIESRASLPDSFSTYDTFLH